MSYADTLTLDQLRVLLAVCDEGTFSGAARQLHRSQGAISYQIASMEQALGFSLFDRSTRRPQLTPRGATMAREAQRVLERVTGLKEAAAALASQVEPTLTLAVDTLYPVRQLARALGAFRTSFPHTTLELHTGVRTDIGRDVAAGTIALGIVGELSSVPESVVSAGRVGVVQLVAVAARHHPLARWGDRPVPDDELACHPHIVLRERGADDTMAIPSPRRAPRWRVSDQHTQQQLVTEGLGWSRLPNHLVADQLERGALRELTLDPHPSRVAVTLHAVHRRTSPPGLAGRWLIEQCGAPAARAPVSERVHRETAPRSFLKG